MRVFALPMVAVALALGVAAPSAAAQQEKVPEKVIVLPGAKSAEGIAAGRGSTFYAGDLFAGDIYRGDARRGTAELFIDAPTGRNAIGMNTDLRHDLLFVAGGFTGQAYVYDIRTRKTVAVYQFADANAGMINDVKVTGDGAWFTDSLQAKLYFVPVGHNGRPGTFRTLTLTGPAGDTSGAFNNNGITTAPDGRTLIVAHSTRGELAKVNPRTGASETIQGVSVPGADGIIRDGRTMWVVHANQVSRIRLNHAASAGTLDKVITSTNFQTPSTAAKIGDRLAVVNAKFDTGFPPTADQYEVIVVNS
jgi:sugar lactone lactonase YvrE